MRPTYAEKLKERARFRRKMFMLAVLLAFLVFLATTLFGETGILVNMRIRAEYDRLQREAAELRAENQRLMDEIRALRDSDRKVEAVGRRELGFGRPGEVVFVFPERPEDAVQEARIPVESGGN